MILAVVVVGPDSLVATVVMAALLVVWVVPVALRGVVLEELVVLVAIGVVVVVVVVRTDLSEQRFPALFHLAAAAEREVLTGLVDGGVAVVALVVLALS